MFGPWKMCGISGPEGSLSSTTRNGAFVQRRTNFQSTRSCLMTMSHMASASAVSVPARRARWMSASLPSAVVRGSIEMNVSAWNTSSVTERPASS